MVGAALTDECVTCGWCCAEDECVTCGLCSVPSDPGRRQADPQTDGQTRRVLSHCHTSTTAGWPHLGGNLSFKSYSSFDSHHFSSSLLYVYFQ